MPITIQEIIASDTISQLVDKTNFNFDQLLLNGGGPGGPVGPAGPVGPGGGRGPKGSTWYEDTATSLPATDPNTIIVSPNLLTGDYYLDFDGWVWEYITAAWVKSTINLTGPQGSIGASGSFGLSFGSPLLGYKNTLYCAPIGTISPTTGATAANEGVPSIMMGGVATDTATTTGVPLTAAYQIPDAIAQSVTSNVASVLIHQRNNGGRSIVFHGGNAPTDAGIDKFEQVTFSNLSNISIGVNDRLQLNVPKRAIGSYTSMNDLVGVEITSEKRSHSHRAGQQIRFVTGIDNEQYSISNENSNFEIQIQAGSNTTGNKFQIETQGTRNTLTEIGNVSSMITAQPSTAFNGRVQYQASDIRFITAPAATSGFGVYAASAGSSGSGGDITLNTIANTGNDAGTIFLTSGTGGITGTTTSGSITLTSTAGDIELLNYENININANGSGSNVNITANSTSGKIVLGDTNGIDTDQPKIEMIFKDLDPVTNIRGRVQYMLDGTPNNTNIAVEDQAIYIETGTIAGASTGYSAGDVVMRMGGETSLGAGVAALAVMDGTVGESMYLGKSANMGLAYDVFGESQLGLYINSTNTWLQGVANLSGISNAGEKFRATEKSTKINNVLIWGGKNGGQLVQKDPLSINFTNTIESIDVQNSFLRIEHVSNQETDSDPPEDFYVGSNVYSAGNTGGLVKAFPGNQNYVKTYVIAPKDDWYTGQRMHIEVLNTPANIRYKTSAAGSSYAYMRQDGLIKLKIPFKRTSIDGAAPFWEYLTFNCGGPSTTYTDPTTTTPQYQYGDMTGKILNSSGVGVVNSNPSTAYVGTGQEDFYPRVTRWSATFQYDGRPVQFFSSNNGEQKDGNPTWTEGVYRSYTWVPGWVLVGEPKAEFIKLPEGTNFRT